MMHTNTKYRLLASLIFASFLSNTLAPTLQFAFADSTQYYVDAIGGLDTNDGQSPATAWQTLSRVNSEGLLQGDTVSFLCDQSWSGVLDIQESGGVGLPITFNTYGTGCSADATLENVALSGAAYITLDGLDIATSSGDAINITNSSFVNTSNVDILFAGVTTDRAVRVGQSDNINITSGVITFSGSDYGISVGTSDNVLIDNMIFTGTSLLTAISGMNGGTGNIISNNYFSDKTSNMPVVDVSDAIVRNNTFVGRSRVHMSQNTIIQENVFLGNVNSIYGSASGGTISRNYFDGSTDNAISLQNAEGVTISDNTFKDNGNTSDNQQGQLYIGDSSNITVDNNTFLFANKNSIYVSQTISGAVSGIALTNNTLLQRNIDYPYIEMHDDVPGTGTASLVTANGNNFVTLYKPDTSYVRSVKFGGETVEYNKKADLDRFDATNTRFQSFGYAPYTSTGNYATANLLTNPDFEADVSGWTPYADVGATPSLSQVIGGTYSGNSLLMTPQDVTPDNFGITNDAIMSITTGQVYEVSGYLRSNSTGELNIKAYLHQGGSRSTIYSDRIVETYSTATGRTFRFYITTTSDAADAQLSLESTNQDIALEIDEVSFRRKTIVMKNTEANEVLVFSNTGSSPINQGCPGGVPCAAYVDTANASIGWPGSNLTIPAYSTRVALWNNSPNLVTIPQVSMMIDSGSIPSGTQAHISWVITGSTDSSIEYTTQGSGTLTNSIANIGDIYFEPPAGATTTTYIYTENEIGTRVNSVDVTTTNTPPVVYPVTLVGNEDAPTIVGTLSGIDYNPGDSVFYEEFTDPAIGDVMVNISGTATYLPTPDFCGSETFDYRAYDQYSNYSDPGVATVQITCTNDAPATVADSVTVTGAVSYFDVLANDTDIDSIYEVQSFFLTGYTQPTHGTISIVGNQFEYIVDNGYIGADSFTYVMEDQSGALSNTGTVTIDVIVPNTPPVDYPASYMTNEDTPYVGTVTGSDINPDTLTFTASTLPTNGTLSLLSNGSFTYTPTANYNGTDSFVYQVFDGAAYSTGAQIDLTITSVPDAPVAVADSYSLVQDTSLIVPVMANDTDADTPLASLTLTGYTNPSNGTVSVVGTGFLYTPNTGYSGSDSFMYQLEDETALLSSSVIVSLNVTPTNTPPVVSDDAFTLNEDASITQTLSGSDPELSTLTYILDTLPTSGTVSLSATGVFTYIPDADFNGTDSFTFHANDAVFDSNIATVTLTVDPVNDLPSVLSGSYAVQGNSYASSGNIFPGTLSATDIDSSLFTFTASTVPAHGIFSLTSTGYYEYTPAYGYTGTDSFDYMATDDMGGDSNLATITFNISGINAAPFASSGTYTTNEDTALALTLSGSDPDGDSISYVRDANVATGTLVFLANGNVTYTPPVNYNGTVSFTFHANDGLLSSPSETITIDVLPVNDAPTAAVATFTATENTTTNSGNVLTGTLSGTDVEGTALTYAVVTSSTHGTLVLSNSGTFTYTPDIGYVGSDTFTYRVSDGLLQSTPVTVTITVGIVTPPVQNTPVSGPGGGGGGGTSNGSTSNTSTSDSSFNAAPNTYMGFQVEGLAGQLFLVNRTLSNSGYSPIIGELPVDTTSDDTSIFSDLLPEVEFAEDPAVFLRQLVRIAIGEAEMSDDPLYAYDDAIVQIEFMDTEGDERLTLTKEYALRILQFRQRMYEEMIYRDLNSAPIKSEDMDEDNLDDTPEEGIDDVPAEMDEEVEDILSLLDPEETTNDTDFLIDPEETEE